MSMFKLPLQTHQSVCTEKLLKKYLIYYHHIHQFMQLYIMQLYIVYYVVMHRIFVYTDLFYGNLFAYVHFHVSVPCILSVHPSSQLCFSFSHLFLTMSYLSPLTVLLLLLCLLYRLIRVSVESSQATNKRKTCHLMF